VFLAWGLGAGNMSRVRRFGDYLEQCQPGIPPNNRSSGIHAVQLVLSEGRFISW